MPPQDLILVDTRVALIGVGLTIGSDYVVKMYVWTMASFEVSFVAACKEQNTSRYKWLAPPHQGNFKEDSKSGSARSYQYKGVVPSTFKVAKKPLMLKIFEFTRA